MRNLLIRIARWILEHYRCGLLVLEPQIMEIMPEVIRMCQALDDAPQGNEWKRGQAYGMLQKRLREVPKQDIALAIEIAVRKLR